MRVWRRARARVVLARVGVSAVFAAGVIAVFAVAPTWRRAVIAQGLWALLCAIGAVASRRRARREPDARRAWLTLGVGLVTLCVTATWVVAEYVLARAVLPGPRPGDWGQLAGFVTIGLALVAWPIGGESRPERTRTLLDAAIFATASYFLIWVLVLRHIDSGAVGRTVWTFVVLQFAVIALLYGCVVFVGIRDVRRFQGPLGWLTAALTIGFVGALAILWTMSTGVYYAGHPVDLLGCAALGLYVFATSSGRPARGAATTAGPDEARAMILPYVPAVAAIGIGTWDLVVRSRHDPRAVAIAGVVVACVLIRQFLALRDVYLLSTSLEARVRERTRALEHSQAALMRAQRLESLGRLGGGIAHDFNNLLMAIMAHAQILGMVLPDDHEGSEHAEEIRRAVERGKGLANRLLTFARRQPGHAEVFDAGALMRDTERLLKPLLGEKITLTVHAAARDAPVRMDPGQLEQVLINLAVNARDAMPRGGTLRLETDTVTPDGLAAAPPVPHVRVRVTDTGVGMPPDVQARVFEPFFTTKGTAEGTGLGLAVCHGIVEQAGGRISVASTPGAGTTVTILLPHAAEEVEHPPPARESAARGTETVLLAEDEAAVREPLAQVLRGLGYTVLTASDGEEAVRLADACAGPIHLVLTDMVMPRVLGIEAAERIAERHPGARVVVLTGYAPDVPLGPVLRRRGVTFVAKPVTPLELARRVRRVLDGAGQAA